MNQPHASNGRAGGGPPPFDALVVDDEEAGHLLLRQHFRSERRAGLIAFHFVRSGQAALARLQEAGPPHVVLILSDLQGSPMSGLELLKAIKDAFAHLPVYLASTSGDPAFYRQALEFGAGGYQIKPLDYLRLKREVFGIRTGPKRR
jgi:CheY-like chemotaxis protein